MEFFCTHKTLSRKSANSLEFVQYEYGDKEEFNLLATCQCTAEFTYCRQCFAKLIFAVVCRPLSKTKRISRLCARAIAEKKFFFVENENSIQPTSLSKNKKQKKKQTEGTIDVSTAYGIERFQTMNEKNGPGTL